MSNSNNYLEFNFNINPVKPFSEILIAQLGEIGFESFIEIETGIKAYIQGNDFREEDLLGLSLFNSDEVSIDYHKELIKTINWNQEWESNFNPISVDESCYIRAPFHEKSNYKFEIIIEPKMSFGTGHHETTHMMVQHLLRLDLNEKSVLDMGCGTAVLAILAEKKGARLIDAIDINHWCYLNSLENIKRNHCKNISVLEGDVTLIEGKRFDLIIANINRNILLQDIGEYAKCLNEKGELLLSGFYKSDIQSIEAECSKHMLNLSETLERNNWVSLKFIN